jgi:sorbitol/mannitol transport system substrate-binding protein
MRWNHKVAAAAGLSVLLVTAAAVPEPVAEAAAAVGGASGGASSINVLMVNNPQMLALQKHIGDFRKRVGI